MHFKKITVLILLLLSINIITVTLGSDKSKLTVANKTEYYLNFIIDGTEYLYIPPARSITHEMDIKPKVIVQAFYAPGQGVKGMVIDTVDLVYTPASTGCTCEGTNLGDCSYTPPTGGSTNYDIKPEDIPTEIVE